MAINRISVDLHTDGSCLGNGKEQNRGGWACVLVCGKHERELSGGVVNTKNNRMELQAAIEGIRALKKPCNVTIYTDSQYVCRCFASCREWYMNGWKNKTGNRPANVDLLSELMELGKAGHHKFKFQYVEGHKGNPYNERCDRLAKAAAMNVQVLATKPAEFIDFNEVVDTLERR